MTAAFVPSRLSRALRSLLAILALALLIQAAVAVADDASRWRSGADDETFSDGGDSRDQDDEEASSSAGRFAKKKPRRPHDYGLYRGSFTALCDAIERDGRKELFLAVIGPLHEKDPQCMDCKPFFNTFNLACRPRLTQRKDRSLKKKAEAGEDAEVTPTPEPSPTINVVRERMPHLTVHDTVNELFRSLALEAADDEISKVIEKFLIALRAREGRTKGEIEYFDLLSAAIERAFLGGQQARLTVTPTTAPTPE